MLISLLSPVISPSASVVGVHGGYTVSACPQTNGLFYFNFMTMVYEALREMTPISLA